MGQMPLTDKQKAMLTALVPYFDDGKLTNTWGAFRGNDLIILNSIGGIPLAQISEWEHVNENDLSVFVELNFFRIGGYQNGWPDPYHVNEARIRQAVDAKFTTPDPSQPVINFHIRDNTFSGITNIGSILNNSTQQINDAANLAPEFKEEFKRLLTELYILLDRVDEVYKPTALTVAKQAERLAQDVSDENSTREGIKITAEGLKAAARNLAELIPYILPSPVPIADLIIRLLR